jgi:hypothetical protein
MLQLQLIHWSAAEALTGAATLQAAGYEVAYDLPPAPELLRRLRDNPPAAVVIDLTRQPSHGRDLALALRGYKDTRDVPLVLVEGDPQKVARIRELLPDATYTTWSSIRSALKRAIAHQPAAPIVPRSRLVGYAGKPLAVKLGIRTGATVGLEGAPQGFTDLLGELPERVQLRDGVQAGCDLALWFVRSCDELRGGLDGMEGRLGDHPLWIIWPKQGSALAGDLTQQVVRDTGLAAGWVDYKVCAVDATWSGLLFRRRRKGT